MEILEKRKFATKKDIIIVLVILAVAVAGLLFFRLKYKKPAKVEADTTQSQTEISENDEQPEESSDKDAEKPSSDKKTIKKDAVYAELYAQNVLIDRYDLSEDQILDIPDNPEVKIEIKDNSVGFISSDCPDQVCVYTGFLDTPGYVAACLPNGVVVVVVSGEDILDAADAVDTTA